MADEGTKRGTKDTPGGAYKRNFNRNPKGRFPATKMKRSSHSRSKSRDS
jgi:hypothetical protein